MQTKLLGWEQLIWEQLMSALIQNVRPDQSSTIQVLMDGEDKCTQKYCTQLCLSVMFGLFSTLQAFLCRDVCSTQKTNALMCHEQLERFRESRRDNSDHSRSHVALRILNFMSTCRDNKLRRAESWDCQVWLHTMPKRPMKSQAYRKTTE